MAVSRSVEPTRQRLGGEAGVPAALVHPHIFIKEMGCILLMKTFRSKRARVLPE